MFDDDPIMLAAGAIFVLGSVVACKPEIGDECGVSTDCSAAGERLCDITQPGGYCTIFNCEPGTCPEESVCINWSSQPSTVAGCADPQGASPFKRVFCMKKCESNDDCRTGYQCIDMNKRDNPWGARVVEHGSVDGRVCAVPASGAPIPPDRRNDVCTGRHDAGFEDALPPFPRPDSGGTPDADAGDAESADTGVDGSDAEPASDATTD
jgi:hypothetical protein